MPPSSSTLLSSGNAGQTSPGSSVSARRPRTEPMHGAGPCPRPTYLHDVPRVDLPGSARFAEGAQALLSLDIKPARSARLFAKPAALRAPAQPGTPAYRRWQEALARPSRDPVTLAHHFPPRDGLRRGSSSLQARRQDAHAASPPDRQALCGKAEPTDTAALEICARHSGLDAAAILQAAPPEAEPHPSGHVHRRASHAACFRAPNLLLESGEICWAQDRLDFLDRALARASSLAMWMKRVRRPGRQRRFCCLWSPARVAFAPFAG